MNGIIPVVSQISTHRGCKDVAPPPEYSEYKLTGNDNVTLLAEYGSGIISGNALIAARILAPSAVEPVELAG